MNYIFTLTLDLLDETVDLFFRDINYAKWCENAKLYAKRCGKFKMLHYAKICGKCQMSSLNSEDEDMHWM